MPLAAPAVPRAVAAVGPPATERQSVRAAAERLVALAARRETGRPWEPVRASVRAQMPVPQQAVPGRSPGGGASRYAERGVAAESEYRP